MGVGQRPELTEKNESACNLTQPSEAACRLPRVNYADFKLISILKKLVVLPKHPSPLPDCSVSVGLLLNACLAPG